MFDGSPTGAGWVLCVALFYSFLSLTHVSAPDMITEEMRSQVVAIRTSA